MALSLTEQHKKTYVLLADDDPFIRRVVRHVLKGLGFENIKEAENAENVLSMLGVLPYGVLISDVQMPGISGVELLKKIRCGQTNGPADLPVIILTSFGNTDVLTAALALDVNGFLVKPIKPDTVLTKLVQALGERIVLQPKQNYEAVSTQLASLSSEKQPEKPMASVSRAGQSEEGDPANGIQLRVRDLLPGMELVREIYLNDGTLLLSRNKTLGSITVNRLQEMEEVLKHDMCWVMRGKGGA